MKKTQKKKTGVLSVVCYILAALFFLYGVYMVIYAVDYIQSYESTGLIDTQNVIQYVVTSSASYLGFAVLLFAAGHIIRMLKNLQPAQIGIITEEITETSETAEDPDSPASQPEDSDMTEVFAAEVAAEGPAVEPELAAEPEPVPTEDLPAKETPNAFEESHIPEIGDTSSALTFHELIIDPPEGNDEDAPDEEKSKTQDEEEEEFIEEISLEEPDDKETPGSDTSEQEETAESQPEPNKPIEKISSSMIRDIFEHK